MLVCRVLQARPCAAAATARPPRGGSDVRLILVSIGLHRCEIDLPDCVCDSSPSCVDAPESSSIASVVCSSSSSSSSGASTTLLRRLRPVRAAAGAVFSSGVRRLRLRTLAYVVESRRRVRLRGGMSRSLLGTGCRTPRTSLGGVCGARRARWRLLVVVEAVGGVIQVVAIAVVVLWSDCTEY